MYTIKKRFGEYPFAHRQHNHQGHCAFVHGHNWQFEIELTADKLDYNGFVYDFGKFKELKKWFTHMFDHTLLINIDDPMRGWFEENQIQGNVLVRERVWDLRIIPCGSAEELARFVFEHVQTYLATHDAECVSVTVYEDGKNSATYFEGPATWKK